MQGLCDDPLTRDQTPLLGFEVPVVVHLMYSSSGTPPDGITPVEVEVLMAELAADFAPYGVSFDHQATLIHNDDAFHEISEVHFLNQNWMIDIADMKNAYAVTPSQTMNFFVSAQEWSLFGYIGGYATFPWDPGALGSQGGLWMNSLFFTPGQHVLSHEVGHTLGLWHTHRGVAEAPLCDDPCRENVHDGTDPAMDLVGDFCKDTPATPANTTCSDPTGTDCNGMEWGSTLFNNFMGYGPPGCLQSFTPEQVQRMHCWAPSALAGLVQFTTKSVHIESLNLSTSKSGSKTRAVANVLIHDNDGMPVPGAMVSVEWTGSYNGTETRTTGNDGKVVFRTPFTSGTIQCWGFDITGVEGDGLSYDPANPKTAALTGISCMPRDFSVGKASAFELPLQVRPNPFNPSTSIHFSLPRASNVSLTVVDIAGRRVRDLASGAYAAGPHQVRWNGTDRSGAAVASGVYFAVLRAGDTVQKRRMLLLK